MFHKKPSPNLLNGKNRNRKIKNDDLRVIWELPDDSLKNEDNLDYEDDLKNEDNLI